MIYSIFPSYDATIYEYEPFKNTGLDSILEVSKLIDSQSVNRILIKFPIPYNSASAYYLRLQQSDILQSPISYSIEIAPLSESWNVGSGKYNNYPAIEDGVSWIYKDSNNVWQSSSFQTNYTASYKTNVGGGVWNYELIATQSFNYEYGDIYANVTNIVNGWNSSSIQNNGFIIKFPDNFEYANNSLDTSLKFYSKESHTIYQPRLDACWDDSIFNTGSLLPLISGSITCDDITIYLNNLKSNYIAGSINKISVIGREKYPIKTFATSSEYLDIKYLPSNTKYAIIDMASNFTVIPFSELYTKISCDNTGNYFNLYTSNLLSNRLYKLIFAINNTYFDNNYIFKING